jgi:hypothetical protein
MCWPLRTQTKGDSSAGEQETKMRILSSRIHGILDYVTVVGFALVPTLLGLDGLPKWICYALAGIHLLLTLLTNFPLGAFKRIPLTLHGLIELIVSIALVILPWVLGFADYAAARYFFVAAGGAIFVVWVLTEYSEK